MIGYMFSRNREPFLPKIELDTWYTTKSKYSFKRNSFLCFVHHRLQTSNRSILLVLLKSLGHVCDNRYQNKPFLHYLVVPDQPNIDNLWYFSILRKHSRFFGS